MAMRSAAISGFALAAALLFAQPGRAQGFFSFFDISPRQIVGMLQDDGYQLRGPLIRRGDVYVCDVVSVSGRAARLVVDAHNGHIVEHYAARASQWRNPGDADVPHYLRPPRDVGEDDRDANSDDGRNSGRQTALGDPFNPPSRVYGGDSGFQSPPEPADAPPAKPKHHAAKKHKEPSVAKAPPSAAPTSEATTSDKPSGAATSSLAAVAPAAAPEPAKPVQDSVKPGAPAVAAPAVRKVETEKASAVEPKPASSPKPAHKKINDLPVGTLD